VPANSPRWSINVGFPSELSWQNILLHFNPRKEKKKRRYQLLHNNRTDNHWGLIESMLIEEDLLFGRTFELVFQVSCDTYLHECFINMFLFLIFTPRFSQMASLSQWMAHSVLTSRTDRKCTTNRKLAIDARTL
jgi:hypothetical protein